MGTDNAHKSDDTQERNANRGDHGSQQQGCKPQHFHIDTHGLGGSFTAEERVSFLGIIGFVGIICPHVTKKLLGQDHRVTIPASALSGSLLLLLADTLSRSIGSGSALPVGAITSLLGAPFFLAIIFSRKEHR